MKSRFTGALITFGISCVLFVLITFPWILDPLQTGIGQGIDPYQYLWNADVFSENVKHLENPFFSRRFFYPEGTSLWMHTYTPIIGCLNLLIDNPFFSVGLALCLSFGFSASGGYLLGRHFQLHPIISAAIGLIYAFSPYKTAHLAEHHHLLLTGHVPYFILYFLRSVQHVNGGIKILQKRHLWTCFLLLFISFLSDYYTTAFLLVFAAAYLIWPYGSAWLQSLPKKVLVVSGMIVIPGIHFMVKSLRSLGIDDKGGFYNSADIAGLLIPNEQSWLYQFDWFETWRKMAGFKGPNEQVVFLGLTLFALCFGVMFLPTRRTHPRWVWGMVILFALLSFPKLKFLESPLAYGPFSWIHQIPFFNHIRNPGRYFSMVYLFLPLALALKAQSFIDINSVKHRVWVSIMCVCILFEYAPRRSPVFQRKNVPVAIQELAHDPKIKTVLMIPDGIKDGFKGTGDFQDEYILWSTIHRKETPGGYISRVPGHLFEKFEEDSVLAFIRRTNASSPPSIDFTKKFLIAHKVDAIVVHPKVQEMPDFEQNLKDLFHPFIQSGKNERGLMIWKLAPLQPEAIRPHTP